jgi:hypothetical protein
VVNKLSPIEVAMARVKSGPVVASSSGVVTVKMLYHGY